MNTPAGRYAVRGVHPNSTETEAPALDPAGSPPVCVFGCLSESFIIFSYFIVN